MYLSVFDRRFDLCPELKARWAVFFALLIFSQTPLCMAGIYKCTGPGGRVSMGDLPCTPSNSEFALLVERRRAESAITPATPVPEKVDKEQTSMALEKKILQLHSPECRAYRVQLRRQSYFADASLTLQRPIVANDVTIWERYQSQCLAQAGDVVALSVAQQEGAERELSRRTLCERKAAEYEKWKKTASNLSEIETRAFSALASEVARGCR